jgi:hypothetical protein
MFVSDLQTKLMKKMEYLTKKQRKKITRPRQATKYNCTDLYVRLVLKGEREDNSDLARAIINDA